MPHCNFSGCHRIRYGSTFTEKLMATLLSSSLKEVSTFAYPLWKIKIWLRLKSSSISQIKYIDCIEYRCQAWGVMLPSQDVLQHFFPFAVLGCAWRILPPTDYQFETPGIELLALFESLHIKPKVSSEKAINVSFHSWGKKNIFQAVAESTKTESTPNSRNFFLTLHLII